MDKRRLMVAHLMRLLGIDGNGNIGPRPPKVHSDRYGNRSKYMPHQGAQECERRKRQMARG